MIIFWVTLSTVVCATWAESLSAPSNEIDTPTVRIDPVLRKALLKALSNLEREELEDENTTTESSTTQSEELLEESTSSDHKPPLVQYHTYIIDRNSSRPDDDSDTIFQTIILPKTTLSPPKQSEKKKIIFSVPDPVKDSDIKIETVQLARSVTANVQANEIHDDRQLGKTTPSKDLLKSTTTTSLPSTTTVSSTTTEAPVTNEYGENIEEVREVQIHQAPLVAAFTVQQDEQGLPKRVVPIFKHAEPLSATTVQSVPAIQSLSQSPILPTPNTYQQALENKQRELEQKIQFLQAQQRQQEQLIRQHQLYQEQQHLQRQQQILLEQRLRLEEQRLRQQRYEQEQRIFRLQQRPPIPLSRPTNSDNIQLLSSVSLTPPNGVLIEQQLPIKEAVNFRNAPLIFTQPPHLFPSSGDRNRVFRHDSETGNFGFNNNNNNNNFRQQQQQLRHIAPAQNANQQLQNLLYQSGISGRSQEEDLNIITRVLALNHGITTPSIT
uniref:Putative transcription factor spt20 n=1 Tax=Lutzomyia longipalpis TaxID=7200 RepID=A0A1B0CK63_LUTLO